MAKFRHYTRHYKGRRVLIRGKGGVETDVSNLEKMVREDYKDIWKEHIEDLEDLASDIQNNAEMLVPLDTGALMNSIEVRVSRSRRYPGIIAHVSATNAGYDYALIQEETEPFDGGKYAHDDERLAHYLGGSFASFLAQYYEDITGEELVMSSELEHAKDYIESGGEL